MARSTLLSQNVKSTTCWDHFWRFRCSFAWHAQGILHLAKSEQNVKVCSSFNYNHHYTTLHYTTLDYTTLHTTATTTTTTALHYTTLHCTTLHSLKNTTLTTLHITTLHLYPTLHYTTTTATATTRKITRTRIKGPDNPTSQLLPIMSFNGFSGDRKDKGGGERSRR